MFKKKEKTTTIVEGRPKKKIKRWKIVAIVIVVLIVLYMIIGSLFGGTEDLLPVVDTTEVTEGDITATLETSGIIGSEDTRVYASPVNAQVGDVPVVVGQQVLKGEYLLTYDTTSLQKSYDIAELQAKAEEATTNDTLAKSSESATDFATSESDIKTLQSQIDTLNAEISNLQAQATGNEVESNNNAHASEELAKLKGELEAITAQMTTLEAKEQQSTISGKEKDTLTQLRKDKKTKEKEISKKEKKIKSSADIANNLTNIQAQLTQKNTQLADLQSKLAEAQSKNAAAEAGVLSDAAKANISYSKQASKLTLEQTATDLSKAKAGITADFDGIVTDIQAAAGTMATEGTPLITLASSEQMCVEVAVSKYNLTELKEGQKAVITFQDKEYQGTINYISKVATKNETGAALVAVKVHIDNPDDDLIIGLDAKVNIDLGTAEDVLVAPISAVNSDTQGDFIYVVEEGIVVKKYVTTGMTAKETIEIKSGINKGEKIITSVNSDIAEGIAVTENVPMDTEAVETTEAAE